MEARGFPGAQIAIVQGGELVHARGFGVKNRDEGGEELGVQAGETERDRRRDVGKGPGGVRAEIGFFRNIV